MIDALTNERESKCGLVGGLGVAATVHYYEALAANRKTAQKPLHLVIAHADVARVFTLAEEGRTSDLAEYLTQFLRDLASAGCTFAVLPAVLPHLCIEELLLLSPLPIVNLLDVVRSEITARRCKRVAVFGTRFAMETNLFGSLDNFDVVVLPPHEVDQIHTAYTKLVLREGSLLEVRAQLVDLANVCMRREQAELIVLAGTDFSLVFNGDGTPFPALDCAETHLRAIERALEDEVR